MESSSRFGAVVRAVMLGLLCAGSFLWEAGVTAQPPGGLFVLAGLVGLALAGLSWHNDRYSREPILLCLLGYAGLTAVSVATSIDTYLSVHALANCLVGVVAFFSVAGVRSSKWWSYFAGVALGVLACGCFWGFSLLGQDRFLKANFTNPDCFSVLPLVGFFLALSLFSTESVQALVGSVLGSTVMCVGVFLTGCRAALVGMAMGLLYLTFTASSKKHGRRIVLLGWGVPGAGLFLLLAVERFGRAFSRLGQLLSEGDPGSFQARLDVLLGAPATALDHPLLGSGPGTFHLIYQSHRPELQQYEDFMNVAHNDFVQVLVDCGLPAFLLFAVFCLGLLGLGTKNSRGGSGRAAASAAGWLAVLVYACFNFALPVASDVVWVFMLAGFVYSSKYSGSGERLPRPVVPATLLLCGLFLGVTGYRLLQAERSMAQAERLRAELRWEDAYAALTRALGYQPLSSQLHEDRASLARRLAALQQDEKWLAEERANLTRARELSPYDIDVIGKVALMEERSNHLEAAEQLWREAVRLAPYSWVMRQSLVRNLLLQRRIEEGLAELKKLKTPRFARVYGGLLAVLETQKPGEGARQLNELFEENVFPAEALETVCQGAIATAETTREPTVVNIFFTVYLQHFPEDLCARLRWASSQNELSAPERLAELSGIIDQIAEDDKNQECRNRAVLAWAREARLQRVDSKKVLERLELELRDRPSDVSLRLTICETYQSIDDISAARTVLREGLTTDPDGTLHARLGELFARSGHDEIATGYYEEALQKNPKNAAWKAKLNELKQKTLLE
ncbi:MAG: O-antigen ligase family protein [Vulcanimicrobiota bacterium]